MGCRGSHPGTREPPSLSALCRCVGTAGASDQIGDQRAMLGHGRLVLQWNDQLPAPGVVVVVLDAGALHERGHLVGLPDLELSEDALLPGWKTTRFSGIPSLARPM